MADGEQVPEWEKLPWPKLAGIGAILTVVTLFTLGLQTDLEEKGKYIPPHMKDGVLVPGHFEKPQQ